MKRTLSLILSMLMVLSLFTGLTVVAAESDIADTGAEADLAESGVYSIDGQYIYDFNGDGTVTYRMLPKELYLTGNNFYWYSIPTMIDGYPVTALGDTTLTIDSKYFYVPACIKRFSDGNFKINHHSPLAVVYEKVTPSSHHSGNKNDFFYPLYEYHLKDDGTAILDMIRPNGKNPQVIPDTLWDGTKISEIRPQAFCSLPGVSGYFFKVEISHIFDSIEQGFFSGFDGASLTLHVTGETQIANGAFDGCYAPYGIILNVVGDKDIPTGFCTSDPGQKISVNVGGEIRQIKEDAFSHSRLYDITVNGNVETVGANAFSYTNAESLTLKRGVKSIGERAFYRCGFTEVTIPKSVTQIGSQAFGYAFDADHETVVKIDGFTIYGYRNTAAERYANENGFTFVPLDNFDLWLGKTQVTADNMDDIFGDGKASFDPDTNTLVLNDPTITGVHSYNAGDTAKIYTTMPGLTLTGSYHMTAPEAEFGIRADNNTLRFDGDFTFMGAGTGVVGSEYITVNSGLLTASGQYGLSLNPEGNFSIYSDTAKVDLSGSESAVRSGAKYLSVSASLRFITPEDAKILADSSGLKNFYEADGITLAKRVLLEKPAPLITTAFCTVTEPVAGQKPSYTATVPAGKGYQVEEDFTDGTWVNGVLWQNVTDNKDMTESDTFEAGKQYTSTVLLDSVADYSFVSSVIGYMNRGYAKVIKYSNSSIGVYRTFTCQTSAILGDVDGDGKVDVFDASSIQKSIAGMSGYPNYNTMDKSDPKFRIADVDKDGKVDIFDASLIQKYIAGSTAAQTYGIGQSM